MSGISSHTDEEYRLVSIQKLSLQDSIKNRYFPLSENHTSKVYIGIGSTSATFP
jgi:hypothetical protein